MKLVKAHLTNYRSILDADEIGVQSGVTVLVGQNESGKTAFLQALHKTHSNEGVEFDYVDDYPRGKLNDYEETHEEDPAPVAKLTYELTPEEAQTINADLGFSVIPSTLQFKVTTTIANSRVVTLSIPEGAYVAHLLAESGMPADMIDSLKGAGTISEVVGSLEEMDLNEAGTVFAGMLSTRFEEHAEWNRLKWFVWRHHLRPNLPKFVYFDDWKILPGKTNLAQLTSRVAANKLDDADRTILGLLQLAKIDLEKLSQQSGYEKAKARLEGISNNISDQIFKYWTQNQRHGMPLLEVNFDIAADPTDAAPFNNGENLYIRIKNTRHRVTVPFNERSKGFIWFFSFLVWFSSIKKQLGADRQLILLLDEPGLSLHALAQEDLLRFIEELSKKHQLLYTTHSPFMVRSDKMNQVRSVEDVGDEGTKVSSNLAGASDKTLFPLQAALGYTVAQNLFISKNNVVVEGPSDMIYLRYMSDLLESKGRTGLRADIVIVPGGGLDKVATFVALLGANSLELVVLHDMGTTPEQKLEDLVRRKIVGRNRILNYGMFRSGKKASRKATIPPTDVEDLFTESLYLELFNRAYTTELGGKKLSVKDLSRGDRITQRIDNGLDAEGLTVRPSGGFNHYRPAASLLSKSMAPSKFTAAVLDRFEAVFTEINALLSA